jgi:hypothetical protein
MLKESQFKTLRHIETVRNYLDQCAIELLKTSQNHDQCKLQSPEAEIFDIYTEKLRDCIYNSPEYKGFLKEMEVALNHHYAKSRHHPEHYEDGINGMNLLDLVEMLCDWKSSTMRHNDGNILKSLEANRTRFKISDQLYTILLNTVKLMEHMDVKHHAEES